VALLFFLLASLVLFVVDFFIGGGIPTWVCILPLIPVGLALLVAVFVIVVGGIFGSIEVGKLARASS
jgi:hypothetical protein